MAYTDVEEEQRSKLPKWLCAEDAEKRSKQNIDLYSQEQVYKAETFRTMPDRAKARGQGSAESPSQPLHQVKHPQHKYRYPPHTRTWPE